MLSNLFTTPYVRDHAASFLFAEERGKLVSTCKLLHDNQSNWCRQDWREVIIEPLLKYYSYGPVRSRKFDRWTSQQRIFFLQVNYPKACTYLVQEHLNLIQSYHNLEPITLDTIQNDSVFSYKIMTKTDFLSVKTEYSLHWLYFTPFERIKVLTYPGTDKLLFPSLEKKIKDPLCTLEADLLEFGSKSIHKRLKLYNMSTVPIHRVMAESVGIPCGKKGNIIIRHTMAQMFCQIHAHINVKRLTPRQHQMLHETRSNPNLQQKIKDIWDKNWETKPYFSPHWDLQLTPWQKSVTGKGADQRELLRRHMRRTGQKGNIAKRRKIE